jgi:hypothetical protein
MDFGYFRHLKKCAVTLLGTCFKPLLVLPSCATLLRIVLGPSAELHGERLQQAEFGLDEVQPAHSDPVVIVIVN